MPHLNPLYIQVTRFAFVYPHRDPNLCHKANIRLRFSRYPVKIHFPEDEISLDTPKHQKYQSFTSTYNYPDEKGDYFFIAFNNITSKVISKTHEFPTFRRFLP